jgi:4-hydroxythreonine-4-phosphate dehydrogenase
MGEPAGVGGEVTIGAWRALRESGPAFFTVDDPERLAVFGAPVQAIGEPQEAERVFRDRLPVVSVGSAIESSPGLPEPKSQRWVMESIKLAVQFALRGAASAVVTNPIQKSALIAAGFEFPGHTEYLAALTSPSPMPSVFARRGPVMMLATQSLRTVPVTIHMSLADAVRSLSTAAIFETACVVAESLRLDFGIADPRLAVSGLNPHAGEGGLLGGEDAETIAPALGMLRSEGILAVGPLAADAMFHEDARKKYDAAICMYHDQALIPIKTLAFHHAVNVTLGLPIVRTSPDHGTALDIAGRGIARPDSLIAAIRLAAEIASRRSIL